MVQNYLEQKASIEREEQNKLRENQATQQKAYIRHYRDAIERIVARPIDPSGNAVKVRSDILFFISKRIEVAQTNIQVLLEDESR